MEAVDSVLFIVMAKWKKQTLKLQKNHRWKAKPGYRICVLGRGAVRFDIPQGWIMEPDAASVKFYDGAPPDDNCRLEASYNLIPSIDWSGFPLEQLLKDVVEGDHRGSISIGEVISVRRVDLRLVWTEFCFQDLVENREAHSRVCIGIGNNVQCLITMDFWPEDRARATPVWDEALRTLKLGMYVSDPTLGDAKEYH
ncbi:MAG: hypothetical protein ACR2LZ_08735, partial [Pyrinomonadaceae bacterium]